MSFERIGPYRLVRSDLIAASVIICFKTGGKYARIRGALLLLLGVIGIFLGVAYHDSLLLFLGLLLPCTMFVVGPVLRKRSERADIFLSYQTDGLAVETENALTLYRWPIIRSFAMVGSRLFIMISDNCALVVPNQTTTANNMANLIETLAAHQRS
jgi:hypothetical protein